MAHGVRARPCDAEEEMTVRKKIGRALTQKVSPRIDVRLYSPLFLAFSLIILDISFLQEGARDGARREASREWTPSFRVSLPLRLKRRVATGLAKFSYALPLPLPLPSFQPLSFLLFVGRQALMRSTPRWPRLPFLPSTARPSLPSSRSKFGPSSSS